MIHLAFISYLFPDFQGKGGIGTYVLNASEMMINQGYNVEVFCGSDKAQDSYLKNGVTIHPILCESPNDFRNKMVEAFTQIHHQNPFDLIESAEVNADAIKIKRKYPNLNLVVRMHTPNAIILKFNQVHNPFLSKLRFVMGSIKKGSLDLGYWRKKARNPQDDIEYEICAIADAISTPSNALKNWAVNYWGLNPERIKVIPNPVTNILNTIEKSDITQKQILFLGRMDAIKGVVNFTKAMKTILHKNPDWKVIYAGSDSFFELKKIMYSEYIFKELAPWKNQIIFKGDYTLKQLGQILADSSICVIPSYFESFSYTCTEAMSASKAMVCSNTGAFPEIIENGKEGLLVNPYSAKDIAKAVTYLIKHPVECEGMGQAAQLKTHFFSPELVASQMAEFYLATINGVNS